MPFIQHKEWGSTGTSITTKCWVLVRSTLYFEGSKRPDRDHGRQRLRHGVRARAGYMLIPTEYSRTSVPGRYKGMYP